MMFKYMCLILFVAWYQLADCHPAGTDVQSIETMIEKESDAFLSAEADASSHKTVRDKRTIGFLRQLFPSLSQIVDRKIQQITRLLFRVIGRLVLRGGGGGGGGAGTTGGGATGTGGDSSGSNSGGRRISITLPTYPPSADDEEETTETDNAGGSTTVLPQQPSPSSTVGAEAAVSSASVATVTSTTVASEVATGTFSPTITTQNTSFDTDNQLSTDSAAVKKRTAREVSSTEESTKQRSASLSDTDVSSDDGSALDDKETEEDPRNKRFLFNLKGGGGGGSGNFLFDLIRRGADRAARAAGGFYRVVAGTDPNTLTLKQPLQYPLLVAGSGATQDRDESSNTALEEDGQDLHTDSTAKEDGYSVGVPGPLTRIFVIANRGVANLVQDLILRLAQTTERIVNFKARLITSLI